MYLEAMVKFDHTNVLMDLADKPVQYLFSYSAGGTFPLFPHRKDFPHQIRIPPQKENS